jgi:uncharacterized protein YkwD
MRRLAYLLLPLGVGLGVACTAVDPDSGYPGLNRASGPNASEDAGGADPPGNPSEEPPGSTPTPLHEHDAGSWGPLDAGTTVFPPPANTGDDAGNPFFPPGDDAGNPSAEDSGAGSIDSGSNALLTTCAGSINAYRAQNGLPAYTVSTTLLSFAAQATATDALSGQIDGYFDGNGGNGVSSAEDEWDGDEVDQGAAALEVLNQGLVDEENGYLDGNGNLLSQQFSQVGCGVAQASDGSYWIAVEYR